MGNPRLGRRRMIGGGLALALTCRMSTKVEASPKLLTNGDSDLIEIAIEEVEEDVVFGPDAAELAASHAPFRTAFVDWLGEAQGRFALPVSVQAASPSYTVLRVPGLHPALEIALQSDTEINVYVTWKDVCWDIVFCSDVFADRVQDGAGWHDPTLLPEARRIYPTRDACWRDVGFEQLLDWFDNELAPATHLALYGGEECDEGHDWTAAYLARDGMLLRSKRPIKNNGPLRHLLPLYPEMV